MQQEEQQLQVFLLPRADSSSFGPSKSLNQSTCATICNRSVKIYADAWPQDPIATLSPLALPAPLPVEPFHNSSKSRFSPSQRPHTEMLNCHQCKVFSGRSVWSASSSTHQRRGLSTFAFETLCGFNSSGGTKHETNCCQRYSRR